MLRKILAVITAVSIILCLCGCDLFTADTAELLSPPELSGDLAPIAEIIKKTTGGEYTLKYPSRGDYRSAVIKNDIDGDGQEEAFAFYSTTDGETVTMNLNVIVKDDKAWKSTTVQRIVAGGIDKVEFTDLDGDSIKEIIVGWEIYGTSEMQLSVYSMGDNSLTQRLYQRYTHFIACDLNQDLKNEIFVVKAATAEQKNSASLLALFNEGIIEIASCQLDSVAKTINEPILAKLSSGKPAVYIDEIKGAGAVTEVLFVENDKLLNPLFDNEKKETEKTLRSIALSVTDINGDGVLEIPVQEEVPSVTYSDLNEKLYLTNWCSFNGEKLTVQLTAMMNLNDGYYYIISAKWVGKIAILKDTEAKYREIYIYNPEDMSVGESLMYFKLVKKKDWESGKYTDQGLFEVMNDGETSVICYISDIAASQGVTPESVKSGFSFTE